ncbi:hypothetical protein ACLGIH_01065 [Streptomyces sp. HMX87]|uniref:hypothetical protein n=1 Tax=Streptomyces sp. HMX87 TaxID=3390849 RepID=UPI003A85746B
MLLVQLAHNDKQTDRATYRALSPPSSKEYAHADATPSSSRPSSAAGSAPTAP